MTELSHPDRRAKLDTLREHGINPYPTRGVQSTPISEVLAGAGTPDQPGPLVGQTLTISGRMLGMRDFGKLIFAPLRDRTGRMQVGLQKQRLAEWWPLRKTLDGGDLLGLTGELGFTQKGEPTLWVEEVTMLAKAVAAPPEKWHGLTDKEARYRRRYVDLWASEGVHEVFVQRAKTLGAMRAFLEEEGYLEVETPTLHPISGGAAARPFVTHHNELESDLYLRIAPELYLKRLIVGGMERVFEFARNFRNEGVSYRHNPEFTMLELYEAQADYLRMMEITEGLLERAALAVNGNTDVSFRGETYSLKAPFARVRYTDLFKTHTGVAFDDEEGVRRVAKELGHALDEPFPKIMNNVFEALCEPHLVGPVFCTDYPVSICPLAKASEEDARIAERFEVFIAGMELGNAFTELNDPVEQERRFREQVESKDPEAPGEVDIDYVQALEFGMPPTGGLGLGIDRIVMLLTGCDSIRDVLLFPAMRHRGQVEESPDPELPIESASGNPA